MERHGQLKTRFLVFYSIALMLALTPMPAASAATPEEICKSSTPMNCGGAVGKALKVLGDDPKRALELGLLWGAVFESELRRMKGTGQLKTSEKDSEKIEEAFRDEVDPIAKLGGAVLETLVKRYLPKVATVLGLLESPVLGGLAAFFDSSQVASDFDELRLLNDSVQAQVAAKLDRYLGPDWQKRFAEVGARVGPELKALP